jgi:hypothetical protein
MFPKKARLESGKIMPPVTIGPSSFLLPSEILLIWLTGVGCFLPFKIIINISSVKYRQLL